MATTVHIPERLLKRVDERAKALGISRNRLIVDAVEATLVTKRAWPPELLDLLSRPLDRESADALETSLGQVRKRRANRKRPPRL